MNRNNLKYNYHVPVLLDTVIENLKVDKGKRYIDATVGGGGYALKIANLGGKVLGIDVDPDAIKFTSAAIYKLEKEQKERITLRQGNFEKIKEIAGENGFEKTDGILFDLGVSSFQLNSAHRGFSFRTDGPLDMRMNQLEGFTAADLINKLTKEELYEIFSLYAEEIDSRPITEAIIRARTVNKIETTTELAAIIAQSKGFHEKIHPATKVFQAIRIALNDEISNLKSGLKGAEELLRTGGRLVVISYHSLEDRQVKMFGRRSSLREINKHLIVPGQVEMKENPRSRSARLRIYEKS